MDPKLLVTIILYGPLLGAAVAGLVGRRIGDVASQSVTTGFLFLSAILSWVIFSQWTWGGLEPFTVTYAPFVHVDCTTISPRVTRDIASKYAERGVLMLDAPVSGGEGGAVEGANHHAGCALRTYLWQRAQKSHRLVVSPGPRWLERAPPERISCVDGRVSPLGIRQRVLE